MKINGREISDKQPPYIVAEISGNHSGDLDKALELIREAKKASADAVKIQAYAPDSITIDCDLPEFVVKHGPWKGRKLYELYTAAHTPLEWLPKLFQTAREEQITLFASVFDREAVDILEHQDCPAYKIASMEIVDTPLIAYAADKGKPMIVSTGMASMDEIYAAVYACRVDNSAILHCVSQYPVDTRHSNLHRLIHLRKGFDLVGLSDHSRGIDIPIAATALGAVIIEKHFMLEGTKSEDSFFSLTPNEFRWMALKCRNIWKAMGKSEVEEHSQLRRSLYVVKDIKRGELFTPDNVRSIRPSGGLPPSAIESVLGMYAKEDLTRGTPLRVDLVTEHP